MRLGPLGELTRDDHVADWWVSQPVLVPLLGVRLEFVLEDMEADAAPEELASAVASFLALTLADRAAATPHVFRNYQSFVEAVEPEDVPVQIESPEDVWLHVRPTAVHVSRRPRRDKGVYVVVTANCDWEQEHGLQLAYRAGRELSRVSAQDGHLTHADAHDLPESKDRIS